MSNYWSNTLQARRLTRRRMLAGSASAAGAAFIIACGGGDNGGSSTGSGTGGSTTGSATGATGATGSTGPTSSLVSPVVDETDSAKRGGVLRSVQAVPLSLDPHQINAGVLHVWHNYSPLFKVIEGRMAPAVGGMEGELLTRGSSRLTT